MSDDYPGLDRNKSSSMENLLYISSPDSAFERSISATASLPSAGLFDPPPSHEDRQGSLLQSAAAFAAETQVTMALPSPEHNPYSSSDSVQSAVSVT